MHEVRTPDPPTAHTARRPRVAQLRATALMSVFATVPLLAAGCSSGSTGHHAAPASGPAASASAQSGAGGVQQITINATNDFRFDPATIHAHVGTLRVTLVDTGSYPHNLAVASLH